jgi:hypothetical protein
MLASNFNPERFINAWVRSDRYHRDTLIYSLAGNRNVEIRQSLMTHLNNGILVPKVKSGIHAIENRLRELYVNTPESSQEVSN